MHLKVCYSLFGRGCGFDSKCGFFKIFAMVTLMIISRAIAFRRMGQPQNPTDDYWQTSNISCTLIGNEIFDHSDEVGASPVGAAPTTSSFSAWRLASMDWPKTTARQDEKHLSYGIWCAYIRGFTVVNFGSNNGLVPQATSHYLNQCWLSSMMPYASLSLSELSQSV